VMERVFMMISPFTAPAGPALTRACKLGERRRIRCDEDHRRVDF
jgi:hypothetical protein